MRIGGATFSTMPARASTRLRDDCRLRRLRSRLPQYFDRQQRSGAGGQRDPEIGQAERRSEQVAEAGDEQCRALRRESAAEGAKKERVGWVRSTGHDRSAPGAAGEGIKELRRDEAGKPDGLTGLRGAAEPRGAGLGGKSAGGDQAGVPGERAEFRRRNDRLLRIPRR